MLARIYVIHLEHNNTARKNAVKKTLTTKYAEPCTVYMPNGRAGEGNTDRRNTPSHFTGHGNTSPGLRILTVSVGWSTSSGLRVLIILAAEVKM